MAQALNAYTAQLPLVEARHIPTPPGTNTMAAIEAGITHAVIGGIYWLVKKMRGASETAEIFFTGGDAPLLAMDFPLPVTLWPEMTLEGIRLAAYKISQHPPSPA
jgi:pantothenate kinase type III